MPATHARGCPGACFDFDELRELGSEKKLIRFVVFFKRSISCFRARSGFDLDNPFEVASVGCAAKFALDDRFPFAADGAALNPVSLFRLKSLRDESGTRRFVDGSEGLLLFACWRPNGGRGRAVSLLEEEEDLCLCDLADGSAGLLLFACGC
jgi:hypothetical protein